MGANTTQAVGICFLLGSLTLLAGSLAGGGVLAAVGALATFGASVFFFMKCKPWENRE